MFASEVTRPFNGGIQVKPTRVLFVLGRGGGGGISRHVVALLSRLDRCEVEPVVCALFGGGADSEAAAALGVRTHVLGARNGHDLRLIIAFWKVLKAERPDVIHLHSLSFFPMAVLHTFRKIPVIYTEHCAFTCVTHPLWTRVLWAMARRRVSRIVAVSGHTGSELSTKVRVAPSTVEVIYNAVDVKALDERRRQPTPEHPHLPANRPIIGGIGRLVDGKGWNLFLATAKRILAVRRDVIFAIVGEGPIEGALKCRAESMCIASNVRFLGHQDGGDMIRRFDVLLFTSEYEQLPTVLLEAFALRTPVVGCVPRGGTREILAMSEEPVGAFEATRDPRVLAAAVLRFLSDGLFSQSCTEAAYRLVAEKFDVEHTGTRLSALYRDLAAGSLGRVSANRPPAPLEPDCRR